MVSRKDILVTLTTDLSDLNVAEDLRKALDCEKHVFFQDIISGKETLPHTQTRISFHGHGDVDIFGSRDSHFNPKQFAEELIQILKTNKQITDIDLLSCNVGMIDAKGYSYAGELQDLLQHAGYNIRINTFVVDNSKNDVHSSFFVVGTNSSDAPLSLGDKSFLKSDEFSLDILRKTNEKQMKIYDRLTSAFTEQAVCNTKIDILNAIYSMCSSDESNAMTLQQFTKEMQAKNYSNEKITELVGLYHLQFIDDGMSEPYVKGDILSQMERAVYKNQRKCENVYDGIYMYKGDATRAKDHVLTQVYHLNQRISQLSEEFAKARAEEGRAYMDKLANIRNYLAPVKELTQAKKETVQQEVSASLADSTLVISSILNASKSNTATPEKQQKNEEADLSHDLRNH